MLYYELHVHICVRNILFPLKCECHPLHYYPVGTTAGTLTGQSSTQPISQGQVQPVQQPPATNPSSHPNIASEMQQLQVLSSPKQPKQPTPIPLPNSQQQPSSLSAVETYAHYLKFDIYLRQKFPTYGKWPPNPAKKFINLALIKKQKLSKEEMDHFTRQTIRGDIDDIVKEKQPISMETIGQPKGKLLPKCILVEGAPGVGKSTFAWKLCRKWSKGKLLQQYRLVVLLRLRDKRVREAVSVSDLFYFYNRQIQQTVVQEIQATGGRGVLLLFEGYDELPAKLRTGNSIFLDVIKGHELPTATILVTSRPSASGPLYEECRDFIAQHVEILGFTDENIQSYLESTTSHDPSLLQGLQQYLTYYPHIRPMLYIPLNCAIVVEVYRVNKSNKTLIPKTWTDLYSSLLRSLLLRYLDDHPVHQRQSWKTNRICDLPADVYQQLCEVSRIACEGIQQDQQVIFSDLPSDFNSLGLMQCVPELYVDEVASESFNFLHLTLQEYLAALHLSVQPVKKQMELFKMYQKQLSESHRLLSWSRDSNDHSHTHFRTVLRFLAGLGKFIDYPISSIRSLLTDPGPAISSSDLRISLDGLHWMFEARCSNVCEALGMLVVSVVSVGRTINSFNGFVLGYCVAYTNCPWKVILGRCGVGDEGVTMLVRGAMEGEGKHSGHISVMDMMHNKITSTGLNQLLNIPKLLKFRQLLLPGNPLGRGGAVLLLKSPLVHNLEVLSLVGTGIGVEDCQALSELLSSSPTLQRIYISGNALPPEAVELIITGLKNHTVLEKLNIGGSQFSLQNCISLASLTQPPRHLRLQYCRIDDEGAIQVAKLLNQNTITSLLLEGNPLIDSGASSFARKLSHNTSVVKLGLNCESIGLEGTQKLIDSLAYNKTLRTLQLPGKYESSVRTSEAYQRVKARIVWSGGKWFVLLPVDLYECVSITIVTVKVMYN